MAISSISNIGNLASIDSIGGVGDTPKSNGLNSFKKILEKAVEDTDSLQLESKSMTEDFITGKTDNIHQVMIAGEKADIALQFTMQIRNKIMDAYNEIMRMQI